MSGLVLLLGLLVTLTSFFDAEGKPGVEEFKISEKIKLNVALVKSDQGNSLKFVLKNISGEAVKFHTEDLPWSSRYSIKIILLDAFNEKLLDEALPIADPDFGIVSLSPKQELTGQILLPERFPGLDRSLKRGDVVIFWTYQLKAVDTSSLDRIGGCFVLKK